MQFGVAILLIMLPRLLVRSRGSAPPIAPKPRWQTVLAKTVHLALYVLLFGTPLPGIVTMAWSGQHWNFPGIPLPSVPVPDKHFSHQLEDIHGTCGNILMYLAAAHALTAPAHNFFQRDDTLKRMLPPARDSG